SATHQLFANLFLVSNSVALVSPVFISQFWRAGDLNSVHQLTFKSAKIGLSIMSAGIAFMIFSGKELISLWLGPENFIGLPVLLIFCCTYLLEIQHSTVALSARATDFEVFTIAALTAGFLNILFTASLVNRLGLIGVALGTILAQLLTNNWYQFYISIKRLKINPKVYFNEVTRLWVSIFIIISTLAYSCIYLLNMFKFDFLIIRISLLAIISVLVLGFAAWNFIFEEAQKDQLKAMMNF
ncbi:MAG: lipopolysaccharide biosynthesis protein, partial [Leptolyngbya sp. SIO3F4]|nr:lipopolysaccharide biosynthesis protein [Leptolyngbya sp. SIO3F4]